MSEPQTDSGLAALTDLMQLDAANSARILALRPILERELPKALDAFYDKVRATPQLSAFFADDAHMAKAKEAQVGHWGAIASGRFDERYVERVRAIGVAHARIGLNPRWYVGGYGVIVDYLIKTVLAELWPKGLIGRGAKKQAEEAGAALGALVKAVFLDMAFAISVYIDAAEAARAKAEREAQDKERALVAASIGAALAKLADKDLRYRMQGALPDAYAKLQGDFNDAIDELSAAFRRFGAATDSVRSSAQEINAASDDLARRTEQQASSLEETSAALAQINEAVHSAAEGAKRAHEVVCSAREDATLGSGVVRNAVEAMSKIESSSQQISHIIGVIDEIAFQTNLLALNAGVEAARAGEFGRGFAVVASEVRALARRSADAAKEIKSLISNSASQVGEGVQLVAQTGEALSRIAAKVLEVNDVVAKIAAHAEEQSTSLQQISAAVNSLDQATQQNAAMSEEASAASASLVKESDRLAELAAKFRTAPGPADEARRDAAPVAAVERNASPSAPAPAPRRPLARAAAGGGRLASAAQAAADDWTEF
jgi:methyl-accepting chemotaxis protein